MTIKMFRTAELTANGIAALIMNDQLRVVRLGAANFGAER